MRPMAERPELFGLRVVLYRSDTSELHGWACRVPGTLNGKNSGFTVDDRSFANLDFYEDEKRSDGYCHGDLPWGSDHHDPDTPHYEGWDYYTPDIHEEEIFTDVVNLQEVP